MNRLIDTARTWADGHQAAAWVLAAALLATALLTAAAARRITRAARAAGRDRAISTLINIAALMATSVQASGMWKFFGNTMGLSTGFRIFMFGFLEVALLACGLRARDNVERGGDAGIDGILVWVLALASGLMSATDAASPREALMRVLVAVIVALLWTRDLMAAKQAARKALQTRHVEKVRWRIRPERIAVWLRLADAADASLTDMETNRKVISYLKATDREARAGRRWPLSSAARAERARVRLASHALLHHGKPASVHSALADRMLTEALSRLGVVPPPPDVPGHDSGTATTGRPDTGGTPQGMTSRDESDVPSRPVTPRPASRRPAPRDRHDGASRDDDTVTEAEDHALAVLDEQMRGIGRTVSSRAIYENRDALGIPDTSKRRAEFLAAYYKSLDSLNPAGEA